MQADVPAPEPGDASSSTEEHAVIAEACETAGRRVRCREMAGTGVVGRGSRALAGIEIEAISLTKQVKTGHQVISDVSLRIAANRLVAVAGGSGAGKTTLLRALAGLSPVSSGQVRMNGVALESNAAAFRGQIGFVPQDDIIHAELTVARTLEYAARLRLPASASRSQVDAAVGSALDALGLAHRADVRVADLSGGQRKRASIAVELLTRPRAFFLDEPTSGLDPASGAGLMRTLKSLTRTGSTVVLTTHAVQDLAHCDEVVFLAAGGYVAFVGTLDEACTYFGVDRPEAIYERLAGPVGSALWAEHYAAYAAETARPGPRPRAAEKLAGPPPRAGFLRQWNVLTQRTFETLARNPLTLAILLGCPALIVAMFAILFRPGAFDFARPSPGSIPVILFWVCFGAFFFGLTYGLLQVITERTIVAREHFVGQKLSAYLLSKFTVLMPFLVLVVVLLLVVLRLLNRLPDDGVSTYASVGLTLSLTAGGALTLGLLTSAAVGTASQATLALPMLCFPAVLFSGAILPVHKMAGVGAVISTVITDRWAFEALGRAFDVRHILAGGGSPLGPPLLRTFGSAGTWSTATYDLLLTAFIVAFFLAAWATLARRVRSS